MRAHILLRAQAGDSYRKIVEDVAKMYKRNISTGAITKIRDKYEETESLLLLFFFFDPQIQQFIQYAIQYECLIIM